MRRSKMSKRTSRKSFTRNAVKVHGFNQYSPMRGGWRL